MSTEKANHPIIDISSIPPQERYAHVLEAFDSLRPGECMEIIADYPIEDLCQELGKLRPAAFSSSRVTSTERWRAVIARHAER